MINCCNKQPEHVDLDPEITTNNNTLAPVANNNPNTSTRAGKVRQGIEENLNAFQRAGIIIIILFAVFLISVPSTIVGSVAQAKNITCAPGAANWLIVFGCIGIGEAAILITFVSNFHFTN